MVHVIKIKRAYEEPGRDDGWRVLVDKFWPRGISKEDGRIDDWLKDIAPSDQLREDFHESKDFSSFRIRYREQLEAEKRQKACRRILEKAEEGTVTLIYSSKNEEENNAVVLEEYLEERQ